MERGDEDLAVRIARSDLPEVLDADSDGPALAALGLGEDELRALLPPLLPATGLPTTVFPTTVPGDAPSADGDGPADMAGPSQTISDRWAYLVSVWTGSSRSRHPGR
jgi:hypothetical protein